MVPLPTGMSWISEVGGKAEDVMRIAGNKEIGGYDGKPPIYFGNAASHWWDGSEVYGPDSDKAKALREGAKIRLVNGHLPVDVQRLRGHRLQRELVARPERDAHAVCARAQPAVRRAAALNTATGTTSASTRPPG